MARIGTKVLSGLFYTFMPEKTYDTMTIIIIILAISVVLLALGLLFTLTRGSSAPKMAEAPPPLKSVEIGRAHV